MSQPFLFSKLCKECKCPKPVLQTNAALTHQPQFNWQSSSTSICLNKAFTNKPPRNEKNSSQLYSFVFIYDKAMTVNLRRAQLPLLGDRLSAAILFFTHSKMFVTDADPWPVYMTEFPD